MKTRCVAALAILLSFSVCCAQTLPPNIQEAVVLYQPLDMFPVDLNAAVYLNQNNGSQGSLVKVDPHTLELTCIEVSSKPLHLQLVVPVVGSITKGDTLLILLEARTLEHDAAYESGRLHLNMERRETWTKSLGYSSAISDESQLLAIPFIAREDIAPSQGQVTIPIGYYPQKIQIQHLRLLNFGTQIQVDQLSTKQYEYEGYQADAPWRTLANERIETHRKAPLNITVLDANQNPIPEANVHVQMTKHAFPFGTAVNEWRMIGQAEKDTIYREKFESLFNRATNETSLKWTSWVQPSRQEMAMQTLDWLNDRDIPVRGHTLVWPSWNKSPAFIKDLQDDPQGLRAAIESHIREIMTACQGKVVEWDVVNEVHNNRDLLDVLGDEQMDEWFRLAREIEPQLPLFINDFGILQGSAGYELAKQESYYQLVKGMLDRGVPLDGIGFQSHFRLYAVTPPTRVWEILDRYAALGLKLGITEYDFAWVSEAFQAQYLKDYMTACFAHPSVNQFVMWGFWDGSHWREDGGMFALDWREKPSLDVYMDLVFNQWWTDENKVTDAQGHIQTRGFLGEYKLTVTANGNTVIQTLSLPKDGSSLQIVMP